MVRIGDTKVKRILHVSTCNIAGEAQRWSNPPANFCLIQKIDPLARKPYKALQVQNCPPCKTGYTPVGKNTAVIATQSDIISPSVANGDGESCGKADRKGNDVFNNEKSNDVNDSGKMEVSFISKDSVDDDLGLKSNFVFKGQPRNVTVDGEVNTERVSKRSNSEEVKCYVIDSEANDDDDTRTETMLHPRDRELYSDKNTSAVDDSSTLVGINRQSEGLSTLQSGIGDKPPVNITSQSHLQLEHCSEQKDATQQSLPEGTGSHDRDTKIVQYNEATQDNCLKNGQKEGESKKESLALQTEIDFDLNEHLINEDNNSNGILF